MFKNKRITKATVKSFINKNIDNLYFKSESSFDPMIDCVSHTDGAMSKAVQTSNNLENTLGISGAWFVGSSRNSFSAFENEQYVGIYVYNCCGSFILAIKK